MKLWFLATAFAVLLLADSTAHAQIGFYINPIFTHVSNSTADSGPFAFLGEGGTSKEFGGVVLGGYDDFFHGTKLTAGVDVRDSIVHADNAGLNSFMVGIRVSGKPFTLPLKPYVQGSVGVGTSHSAHSGLSISREQYGIFAGADYPIATHVDFRVIEVGYGSVTTISSDTVGGTSSIPAANLVTVSTGLVFRFP